MNTYDVILVLGSQPDFRNWQFPSHTYKSLDKALELLNSDIAPYIALSGDRALKFDNTGIKQPFKEADKMEEYLVMRGCPPAAILKENVSRDTLANYYYIKNLVLIPHKMKSILQITAEFRIPRLKFIYQKVLGPGYSVDFQTVDFANEEVYQKDAFVLKKQQEFLKDMKDGNDAYLKDQFYDSTMYRYWKARDQAETDPVKRHFI